MIFFFDVIPAVPARHARGVSSESRRIGAAVGPGQSLSGGGGPGRSAVRVAVPDLGEGKTGAGNGHGGDGPENFKKECEGAGDRDSD